jgi:hypothetical protein
MDIFIDGIIITPEQSNITTLGTLSELNVSNMTTLNSFYSNSINSNTMFVNSLSPNPINIGPFGQAISQRTGAISIGYNSGFTGQGTNAIVIGIDSAYRNQGENSIAIGNRAGQTNQGSNSISIGYLAGSNQASNSIILNASGSLVTGATSNATYISPIRQETQSNLLGYNTTTFEVSYYLPSTPISEEIQLFVGDNQTGQSTNLIIKFTGSPKGSLTGLSNDTSTGIITLNNTGFYYFYVKITYSSTASGGFKQVWLANSIDGGNTVNTSNFSTGNFKSFTQDYLQNGQFLSLRYGIYVSSTPFTCAVGWYQSTDANGAVQGTTSSPDNPTNINIVRIF